MTSSAANWNLKSYIFFPLPYWMTNSRVQSSKQTILWPFTENTVCAYTCRQGQLFGLPPQGPNQIRRVWINCVAEQLLIYIEVDFDSFGGLAHHRNFEITIGWRLSSLSPWFRLWCATSSFRNSVTTASCINLWRWRFGTFLYWECSRGSLGS